MRKIQVLGTGCPKCKKLAETVEAVAGSMKIDYEVTKVTDITEILSFGVMTTPALVIDGTVVSMGKIPGDDELRQMIGQAETAKETRI